MATKVVKAKKERKIRYEDAPLVKRFISYLIDWYVGAYVLRFRLRLFHKS